MRFESALGRGVVIALAIAWVAALLLLPGRPSTSAVVASGLPLLFVASWWAARHAGQRWLAFVRATADWHALALTMLYGLAVLMRDTHGITTDGAIYFSHLRSLIFDRDLDIAREFDALAQPPRPHYLVPVGPLPIWLPFYLFAVVVDAIGRSLGIAGDGAGVSMTGLGLPFVRAVLLASYFTAAAGLCALHGRLRREFTAGVSVASIVLIFGATSLFWYMVYEPSMTHAVSFGLVSLFVVSADRWLRESVTPRRGVILGTLFGLAVLARPQEAIFAVFPLALVLSRATPDRTRAQQGSRLAAWGFLGALPWLLLQAAVGYALFSRYQFRLAGEGGYLNLLHSHWADTLFSSWHGFLSWTPIAYIAVLGTAVYIRRDRVWAMSALLILALMAWINGAAEDWAGGWSFGGRRFTSVLAMLTPGLALLIDAVRLRPLVAIASIVGAALCWNHFLMVQYTIDLVPKDEPVSFNRLIRQQGDVFARGARFYPFAFPANAWFAWREGLPMERYDLLGVEPRHESIDLTMDRRADRFLLEGWDAPGGDSNQPVWWIGGRRATVALPLALPQDHDVAVTVVARTRFEEPQVVADVDVDINGHVVGSMAPPMTAPGEARFVVPASSFRTVWRTGYNRLSFISRGVRRVDPSDTRPPGPIGRRPGNPAWPVAIYRIRIEPVS